MLCIIYYSHFPALMLTAVASMAMKFWIRKEHILMIWYILEGIEIIIFRSGKEDFLIGALAKQSIGLNETHVWKRTKRFRMEKQLNKWIFLNPVLP